MFIRIQSYLEDGNFQNNGDMTIFPDKAIVCCEINGVWALEIHHPIDKDGRWKYLVEDAVVKVPSFNGEQLFRISETEKSDSGVDALAYPIFLDARNEIFLTDVRPTNVSGQQCLNLLLEQNGKYTASSDISRTATAYYEYMNVIEALNGNKENAFVNRWGGEILYDNYKVIVNERIGGDYGVEIRYGKNIKVNGLKEDVDMTDVVTRIYPKSFNGHRMSNKGYVDSPMISKYSTIKCTTITFENIKMRSDLQGEEEVEKGVIICDTQAELDAELTKKCNEQFELGLDKPKITIDADMVLLQNTEEYKDYKILENVSLGDTIHCKHNKLGIVTDARVISLEYDCLLDRVTSVKLGDFKKNYFNDVTDNVNKIESVITPEGGLMADKVEGILNAMKTQLKYQKDIAHKQDVRAILFEDLDTESPTYGAMCLGTQGFQISNKRTADGRDWDWTTAFTAQGGYADAIITGILSDKTGKNFWNLETGEFNMSSNSLIVDGSTLDDLVDSFKLEIHKNHPSMQNYDPNTKEYTPDYTTEPLVLSPSTELGGHSVTSKYVWKRIENGQEVDLVSWEVVGSTGILTINKNFESKQRTYICYATHNDGKRNYVDSKIVEFNKTDDGMNGTSGEPGKDAAIQSPTEPADKTQLWLDTSVDPPLLKQWNGEEWVIVNDTTGEIESLRAEMQKEIGTTADGIKLEVAKNYYTKGEAEQLQSHIGTQLEQTERDFTFKFNEYRKDLNNLEGNVNSEFQNFSKYIHLVDGNIELGAYDEFKQLITRMKNSFLQNGVEVAYIGNRKVYIMDGEFTNSCQIANFGFIPEDNKSLSFRKVR